MNFFNRTPKATLASQLQDIADQAELVETPEEVRELAKGVSQLAAKVAKRREEDDDRDREHEDDDDNLGDDEGGYDEGDNPDDEGEGDGDDPDDVPAAPRGRGRRMTKSLADAMEEAGIDADIAHDVFATISGGLMENNHAIHAQGEMLNKSLRALASVSRRLESLETRLAERDEMLKSVAGFVDGVRRSPAASPYSTNGVSVSPAELLNKSMAYSEPGAEYGHGNEAPAETMRGLTEPQLIKGVSQYLLALEGDCPKGITHQHFLEIGTRPISQLNPKLAEVAAETLRIPLTD